MFTLLQGSLLNKLSSLEICWKEKGHLLWILQKLPLFVCGVGVSNTASMSGMSVLRRERGVVAPPWHCSRLPAVRRPSVPVCSVQVGSAAAAAVPAVAPHSDSPSPPRNPGERRQLTRVLFSSWTYRHSHTYSILGTLHDLQLFTGLILFMTWILFIKSLEECFPRIYLFLSSPNNKIRFICFPVKRKYCICFPQKNGTEKLFLRLAKIL